MSIPGSAEPLLLAQQDTGYNIQRSLRFNSSDSAYLSRAVSTAGNRKTWTLSLWLKRSKLGDFEVLFGAGDASSEPNFDIDFGAGGGDSLRIRMTTGGGTQEFQLKTTQVFRDLSSWYHILVAFDTTQSTASNRIKLYVNGSQVTAFSTEIYPSQNLDTWINATTYQHVFGRLGAYSSYYLNGYLADCYLIDGQALTPSSFTEVSATTGQLIPKAYTGSFGTNGFWLKFSDNGTSAALGTDYSGNGNTWTVNNISSTTGGPTSVVAASGALPIYNTTDTYGATKGSGVRSDSFASSIVACFPLADSSGLISTDESPTGRTSGTKTRTLISVSHSTAASKFYGGSANLTASTSRIDFGDSNDFSSLTSVLTIEGWFYLTGTSGYLFGKGNTGTGSAWVYEYFVAVVDGAIGLLASPDGTQVSGNWQAYQAAPIPANRWHHVALVLNGSGGTTSAALYLNGVRVSNSSGGYLPSTTLNTSAPLVIGAPTSDRASFIGYVQDFRVYKGATAKYTSNFNPPSSTQNATVAAGFDSTVDTPTSGSQVDTGLGGQVTGNYCTWNPLKKASVDTLSNGNLDATLAGSANATHIYGTMGVSSGKWYWEVTANSVSSVYPGPGVCTDLSREVDLTATSSRDYIYMANGQKRGSSATTYGASFSANDVIGIALDMDAGTITFYKNGVSQGQAFSGITGTAVPIVLGGLSVTISTNFGQRQWAYAAPSGFRPLVDTLLPTPVVAKSDQFFQTVLWTGSNTATARTISGLQFSPDLVWAKSRSLAYSHNFYDTVRGTGKGLYSDSTGAESTNNIYGYISAFNSDGFTGTPGSTDNGFFNQTNATYAAWCWDAGSSTVTNTQGSITSQVRANASAGFSIVTASVSASASGPLIGHGLGVTPALVIGKNRSSGVIPWYVWSSSLAANNKLILNSTAAAVTDTNTWGSMTSSTLQMGATGTAVNVAWIVSGTQDVVFYCFAPVAGYSAFGSYTGNGSADGPFVFTGMRTRWVLIKNTGAGGNVWVIYDTARDTYNIAGTELYPNLSNAETAGTAALDIVSNGFKIRTTSGGLNASGAVYIYAAFAENPFQYARAR